HTSGIQEVTLKQEIDVLRKYLEIEQTRFGDRLGITIRIDPDALDAKVPNLLLQPLVENAVRHGIAPYARPGWITIAATREGSTLKIGIADSGKGLPPDRLVALNSGVGLVNTRARLQHLYPPKHRLTFPNVAAGFSVTVCIPFEANPSSEVVREGAA